MCELHGSFEHFNSIEKDGAYRSLIRIFEAVCWPKSANWQPKTSPAQEVVLFSPLDILN